MASSYRPAPLPVEGVALPDELHALVERLAEHAHDVWAVGRLAEGWTHGAERCDVRRHHPCLVPYAELPEGEKEYDRAAVTFTLRAIVLLGFEIRRGEGRPSG